MSYSRKSQESEEGIARQKTLSREFAESKGWVITDEYDDDGVSGAEFHARPGFARHMADAKARRFDVIVTMSTDRIGREAFRTNMALLELAEYGVRVFTYQDRQEVKLSSPIEKQMVSMRNYAAEDFRAQIADKTKAAMLVKARAGRVVGKLPYGYDVQRVGEGKGSHAEYVVNETERAVIERVFTLAASGIGNRRIVNLLADEKVPAPGRAGWSKQIITRMLRNRMYVGEVVFGRTCADAIGGHSKKRARITDESKWTVVTLPALRIVSDKLWAQVQKRRKATLERFGSHRGADGRLNGKPEAGLIAAHLLNGFTVCGVCGGAFTFMGKGKGRGAYSCQRRNSRGIHACSNGKGVPEAKLNEAVLDALHKAVEDADVLWTLLTERAERWKRERALTVDERANLEAEEQRLVSCL